MLFLLISYLLMMIGFLNTTLLSGFSTDLKLVYLFDDNWHLIEYNKNTPFKSLGFLTYVLKQKMNTKQSQARWLCINGAHFTKSLMKQVYWNWKWLLGIASFCENLLKPPGVLMISMSNLVYVGHIMPSKTTIITTV